MSKREKKKYTSIGGQALMEGIMMRGPEKTVMCVRRADGTLVTESVKQGKKSIWLKIPVIRGVVAFVDSISVGTKTLMRSAEIAIEDELKAAEEGGNAEVAAQESELPKAEQTGDQAAGSAEDTEEVAAEGAGEASAAAEESSAQESAGEAVEDCGDAAVYDTAQPAEVSADAAISEEIEAADAPAQAADSIAAGAAQSQDSADESENHDADCANSAPDTADEAQSDAAQLRSDEAEPTCEEAAAAVTDSGKADKKASKADKAEKDKKNSKKSEKKSDKSSGEESGFMMFIATVLGFGLAILLFLYAPTWVASGLLDWLFPRVLPDSAAAYFADETVQQVWRPIIEGVVKLIIFIVYMLLCSTMKEIRTLYMYHGAEHKTIYCYEAGQELTVENVRRFKRFHPRCGTSFLTLMLLVGIAAGIFIKFSPLPDAIKNSNIYYPLIKLALIPLIMGVGYELLKFAGRHDNILTRIISAPGLWFQRITTREPSDEQIECAIAAIKQVIPGDGSDMK